MKKFKVYGSNTNIESQREINHRLIARQIASEGIVLLKNDGVLPLNRKCKLVLYGAGSRMTVRGGSGSGDMRERSSVNLEQGLKNAGFEIVNPLWMDRFEAKYKYEKEVWRLSVESRIKGYGPLRTLKMFDLIHSIPFTFPETNLIQEDELSLETDTAIYVITRQAGEGADRRVIKGDFLLSDTELDSIRFLSKHYQKIILVINSGGIIDLSPIDTIENIKAILYFGQAGMEGGSALADLLTGEVTPSGKLSDTWAHNYFDYPSAETYSHFKKDLSFENYYEGIYVGYRYFDACKKTPRYEFGFGLSYTTFTHQLEKMRVNGSKVELGVRVKNIGNQYSGKEVLQVYISKPSLKYDTEPRSLVAFAKTKLLNCLEDEVLDLSFDLADHALFDASSKSWLLEKGDYIIYVGTSSRNYKACLVIEVNESIITESVQNICTKELSFQDDKFLRLVDIDIKGLPKLVVDTKNVKHITHDYELNQIYSDTKIDSILSQLSNKELVQLCVGAGYGGKSYNLTPGVAGTTTSKLLNKGVPNINLSDGPAGLNVITSVSVQKNGSLRYLDGLPEDWRWGWIKNIEPFVKAKPGKGRELYHFMTAWPSATHCAQTWNLGLLTEMGQSIGKEMLEIGVTLWLAPGMNIHRNPLCGRNFEYYSEDPILSGEMAASLTKGVQSNKGCGVTIKHFCCNNQEDNRDYVSSNLSERALREIYLKGFRIAIRESNPWAVMSSYNKVNDIYTPNSADLLTKVLRQEWNFQGLVMSDWNSTDKCSHTEAIKTGNNLIMPGNKRIVNQLIKSVSTGDLTREELEKSARYILKCILNSAVVNDLV